MVSAMSLPRLTIMAKAPRLGTVKTRLGLDDARSLELYRALLLDKIDQARAARGAVTCVAFAPADAEEEMRTLIGSLVDVHAQRGADLGERLANVAKDSLAEATRAVLMIDADTPTLPVALLEESVVRLMSTDVDLVLGPAEDGGYYLIGQKTLHPSLFADIDWSTSRVLSQTLAAAEGLGLRVHQLQSWYDVDTPADLARLKVELASLSPETRGYPSRTAAWLSRR